MSQEKKSDSTSASEGNQFFLSKCLDRLGAQSEEIFSEFCRSGYGEGILAAQKTVELRATSMTGAANLRSYWKEYARERLSSVGGPVDILRGRYPYSRSYRSELIARLRENSVSLVSEPNAEVISPHFEPTLKRYTEMNATAREMTFSHIHEVQALSAQRLVSTEIKDFDVTSLAEKTKLLHEIYYDKLVLDGFTADRIKPSGRVYRKKMVVDDFDFLLIDESTSGIEFGRLTVHLAVALHGKKITPGKSFNDCLASFEPEDIIPRFTSIQFFDDRSYAQFEMSAKSIAILASILYRYLNAIMANAESA